jgi:hypothetical protein
VKHVRLIIIVLLGPLGASAAIANSLPLTSANLMVMRTCVITGNPSTSTAMGDTVVKQDAAATNFGTGTSMDLASGNAVNHRVYVRFDLAKCTPTIPTTATVKLATLRLDAAGIPTACRTHDVFKVTSTWSEAAITWSNQPFGTTINNPPSSQRSASLDIGSAPCANSTGFTYVSWTVTADTQAFAAAPASNFGWMIRDDAEGSATTRTATYVAKDGNFLSGSPQLIVTYST